MEQLAKDVRVKLAALWTAMMFLYIYADYFSLYRPGQIEEIQKGMLGPFTVTQTSLLLASLVPIIPSAMIFLTLILPSRANRWTNIVLGTLFTLVNVANLIGESWLYYLLFGVLEIVASGLIVYLAWRWPVHGGSNST